MTGTTTIARPSVSELTWQSDLFTSRPAARSSAVQHLSPRAAFQEALWARATLVDIRPEAERLLEGGIPTTLTPLTIEPEALVRWLDPRGAARLPIASTDLRVVVMCQQGHRSATVAAALTDRGVRHATHVGGGFAAWRALGLPVATVA